MNPLSLCTTVTAKKDAVRTSSDPDSLDSTDRDITLNMFEATSALLSSFAAFYYFLFIINLNEFADYGLIINSEAEGSLG